MKCRCWLCRHANIARRRAESLERAADAFRKLPEFNGRRERLRNQAKQERQRAHTLMVQHMQERPVL